MTLPSGLAEQVANDEDIARFLTSSSHYNRAAVKPAAFMPNLHNGETSVFRHGVEPLEELKAIARQEIGESRKIHGAAIVKAAIIREEGLEVRAKEPPPRHADIINWPWLESDRSFGKAQQKEIAAAIAQKVTQRVLFAT